ncbi:MAG TPA: aldo/keto reductase [Cytophagales bacterium]|nr:aldo/keto reductase [Cytophagales bacterium]
MHKRKIPKSGELLPVVGVGTWQTFDVGETASEMAPLKEVLRLLIENGGSVIDSSPMYGRSEKVAGQLIKDLGIRKSIFCATKVWTNGREAGIRQMEQSMDLMNANPMDLMQIHNLVDWKMHLPVLRDWKEKGKIRFIGITHYHEGAFDQVEQVMKKEPLDFIQINYSIRSRDAENILLPLARDKGIAVLINQPFESGSLFSYVKGKKLPEWAKEFDCNSWAQFFLKFILSNSYVTCVIPGTDNPKHLIDNVQAGFGRFPDDAMKKRMVDLINGF